MPAPWGVTPNGFNKKPSAVAISEIDAGLKKILGDSAGTEPDGTIPLDSVAGQIKTLVADVVTEQNDGQQAIYATGDANTAQGTALDAICALAGVRREAARASTVVETCCGTPGTLLAVKRVIATSDTGARFDTLAVATITALNAWAGTHGYVVGQRVTNAGKCYQCTVTGTSAGSGGPTSSDPTVDITDGGAHWRYIGTGTGAVDVTCAAEVTGPTGAAALLLTAIQTPVSGWSTAFNLSDATPGANKETDAALRVRRQQALATSGGGPADAIRAIILRVNQGSTDPAHLPIRSCKVFYNDEDETDANGVPPHSVEVMAYYGSAASATTDQDIANAVWNAVDAGIRKYGNQSATVLDSQGNPQPVKWTKPTGKRMYEVFTVFYDASLWPTDGSAPALVRAAAKSALATYGLTYPVGESVRSSALKAAVFRGPSATDGSTNPIVPAPDGSPQMPGVLDVDPMDIGLAPSPGAETTVAIGAREIATFDTADMTVTATAQAP